MSFLTPRYDPWVVAASFLVACFASYVALDLAKRVRTLDRAVALSWWFGGSIAMGTGIWAMHFVGMLSFSLPIAVGYTIKLTFISWIAAVAVSMVALWVASRGSLSLPRLAGGALAMGSGICSMHYIGMAAMDMTPGIVWDMRLVAASVGIAVGASGAALLIFYWLRDVGDLRGHIYQTWAAIVMGLAISGMHYTGMAAANFQEGSVCLSAGALSSTALGTLVVMATITMLALTLFTSIVHARLQASAVGLQRSEERIRSILANASDAFISLDHRGLITEWNQQAESTFGWARADVVGRPLAEVIIPPRMRDSHSKALQRFAHTGKGAVVNQRTEIMALHRNGHEVPIELSVGALRTEDGFMAHAFLHDITERKQAQARLAASGKLLRDITDNLPLLISYIDKDLCLRFCNATWREWMGVDPMSVVGRPLSDLIGQNLYEQRSEHLVRALAGERISFEVESLAQGVNRFLQTVYIPDMRSDGDVAGIYALSTDITASKQVEMRLSQLAHVDTLTGLPNRRQFEDKLREAVSRNKHHRHPMALMFLDVDHFKQINDAHGHAAGDAVLKEFASRLQRCVRITDTVARLAGDEFVIILEGLQDTADAELVAVKIGTVLQSPFSLGDLKLPPITSSIGVVVLTDKDLAAADVVAKADEALYRAKRAGRDTFVVSHW